MAKIETPVEGYTGEVAGVQFQDGQAETDDDRAIAYFRRHGYTVDGEGPDPVEDVDTPMPEGPEHVGTPLRDAATDPQENDFLPPTNAGEANPHGPKVVSPEVHASQGVKPVVGGDVNVADPDAQEAKEQAATAAATLPDVDRPAGNASHDDWKAYAVSQGMDRGEADSLSRNELRDRYS